METILKVGDPVTIKCRGVVEYYGVIKKEQSDGSFLILANDGTTRKENWCYCIPSEPSWDSLCEGMRIELGEHYQFDIVSRKDNTMTMYQVGSSSANCNVSLIDKYVKAGWKVVGSKETAQEMTVAEICKELGREIKIKK